MSYAIYNFKNLDIFFYTYMTIDDIFSIFFGEFSAVLNSCGNSLSSILRHSNEKRYGLKKKKHHQISLHVFIM